MKNSKFPKIPMSEIIKRSGINNFLDPIVTDTPIGYVSYLDFCSNEDKQLDKLERLSLNVFKKNVQIETYNTSVSLTRDQLKNIQPEIDINTIITTVLVNEMSQSLSKQFLQNLKNLADITYKRSYTKMDLFLSKIYKFFNKEYIKYYKIKDKKNISRYLLSYIFKESNIIAKNSRYGHGNFVILSLQLATILENSKDFIMLGLDSKVSTNGNPYLIGTIGSIQVYVDPYMRWSDTTVYLGRQNKTDQPGIQFMYYKDADITCIEESFSSSYKLILESRHSFFSTGKHAENNYSKFIIKLK